MQCVILCAGRGTRMQTLTERVPKPLIPVCGKPILQYVIEALPPEVDELILVVGYLAEQIQAFCGSTFNGRNITYVTQKNHAGGTGDALWCAQPLLTGTFMVLNADDIHGADALRTAIMAQHAILAVHSFTPELFGVLEKNEDGTLKTIIEKPKQPTSDLINTGGFVADTSLFDYLITASDSGEVYATDMVTAYAKDHPVQIIMQDQWLPIGCPEHIALAEAVLCPHRIDSSEQI